MSHPHSGRDDAECLLTAIGEMWLDGVLIDWNAFYRHERRRRVPLPTYPFQRRRYWIGPTPDMRPAEESRERPVSPPIAGQLRPHLKSEYAAPGTPLERELAEVWEKLFGIEAIGIHDNFFELGGHSLLATQLMSRLRDVFRVELPLGFIFERPTISSLSTLIAQTMVGRQDEHRLGRMLDALERLSDDEVKKLLEEQKPPD